MATGNIVGSFYDSLLVKVSSHVIQISHLGASSEIVGGTRIDGDPLCTHVLCLAQESLTA